VAEDGPERENSCFNALVRAVAEGRERVGRSWTRRVKDLQTRLTAGKKSGSDANGRRNHDQDRREKFGRHFLEN